MYKHLKNRGTQELEQSGARACNGGQYWKKDPINLARRMNEMTNPPSVTGQIKDKVVEWKDRFTVWATSIFS